MVSVVIGFFAADSSSIGPVSGILLLVGFLPAVLAVKECWLVLRPLGYDDLDTDLEAYEKLRPPDSGRAFELRTKEGCPSPSLPRASRSMPTRKRVWSRSTSAWKRVWEWRRALEKRLERSASVTRTADDSLGLTINQLYRKAQALAVEQAQAQAAKQAQDQGLTAEQVQAAQAQAAEQARAQYRWWRVTLNQRSVRRLRDVAKSAQAESTPEDLTAEITSFLSLVRQSNWMVIDQLTEAFGTAAVLFGIQLLLWIAAAVALYLHGAGAAPHK